VATNGCPTHSLGWYCPFCNFSFFVRGLESNPPLGTQEGSFSPAPFEHILINYSIAHLPLLGFQVASSPCQSVFFSPSPTRRLPLPSGRFSHWMHHCPSLEKLILTCFFLLVLNFLPSLVPDVSAFVPTRFRSLFLPP